ncbi:MAG TPA: TerC/Alx family metal homeostasis membrane protein [Candidatus Acidoferrum sp.]
MGTLSRWIIFNIFVLAAVSLDLGVFHRRPHAIKLREATIWSVVWIALSGIFGVGVLWFLGRQPALEFFTGYLIEKALSIDNLFLFLVIFRAFSVDERVQHRLLAWGVLGALVMRGIMIALGAALVERFAWIMYVFGAFLVYAGIHMLVAKSEDVHPEENKLFKWASRHLRVTHQYRGEHFFARVDKKLFATPLFLVLLVVEITDITLAVDSIPAIFGITHDAFIVYTSNVFAILGLRALYFMLAGVLGRLRYLTVGLSFVLIFIGGKMFADPFVHIPVHVSLGVVAGILAVALIASLLVKPNSETDSDIGGTVNVANPTSSARKTSAPVIPALPALAGDGRSPLSQKASSSSAVAVGSEVTSDSAAKNSISEAIVALGSSEPATRSIAAEAIYRTGRTAAEKGVRPWWQDQELNRLLFGHKPDITVGIAVPHERFERIRQANGAPELAVVPPDQDAEEFELHFGNGIQLDVLTTKDPAGSGAIARYLQKFGEGIQQVELRCSNVDRATAILLERFHLKPIYPATRPGASGTKINFFLVEPKHPDGGGKVLIELYEVPQQHHKIS